MDEKPVTIIGTSSVRLTLQTLCFSHTFIVCIKFAQTDLITEIDGQSKNWIDMDWDQKTHRGFIRHKGKFLCFNNDDASNTSQQVNMVQALKHSKYHQDTI